MITFLYFLGVWCLIAVLVTAGYSICRTAQKRRAARIAPYHAELGFDPEAR